MSCYIDPKQMRATFYRMFVEIARSNHIYYELGDSLIVEIIWGKANRNWRDELVAPIKLVFKREGKPDKEISERQFTRTTNDILWTIGRPDKAQVQLLEFEGNECI